MVRSVIIGGIISAIIAMVWSAASWMMLPFHDQTIQGFANEDAVAESIRQNAKEPGMYNIPWNKGNIEEMHQRMARGPVAFMAILPGGRSPEMGSMMGGSFLLNLFVGMMATYVMVNTRLTSYIRRAGMFKIAAVAGTISAYGSQWTWWGFSLHYAVVEIIDAGFAWGLAGLVVAKVVKSPAPASYQLYK
jgi:hypothetical protein